MLNYLNSGFASHISHYSIVLIYQPQLIQTRFKVDVFDIWQHCELSGQARSTLVMTVSPDGWVLVETS